MISPPPHHDIYSIEDLAQLIYDLKQINPTARVCVKLVAAAGVGTVAAGVAKANADIILISGHVGRHRRQPADLASSLPVLRWEMGLAEVHQVLSLNGLRHRVTAAHRRRHQAPAATSSSPPCSAPRSIGVGTDQPGRSWAVIMVRQCHSNTCPVGVCTQDEALRERFTGLRIMWSI